MQFMSEGDRERKRQRPLILKLNYFPGKACHQNNNEVYITECLIEHEKSSLLSLIATQKPASCQPSKGKAITQAHRRTVCMSQRLNPAKWRLDSGGHLHCPSHYDNLAYTVIHQDTCKSFPMLCVCV